MVQNAWEGITFNRYYRGQAQWLSVPPIDSHEVHRIDLVMAEMNQPEAMTPVLRAITNTLTSGHDVWVVGSIPIARSKDVPPGHNAGAAPAIRNAHPMVDGVVFILVEPTGYNAPAGSRAARKGRNNCCAGTGEPFRRRFSRTIHRLQAWYRMIRQAIAGYKHGSARRVRATPAALGPVASVRPQLDLFGGGRGCLFRHAFHSCLFVFIRG